jgi:glutamate racemase
MRITFDPLAGTTHAVPAMTHHDHRPPTLLVFDSGLGGLTVHREIVKARPDARIVYCADDAAFPYGRLDEATLVDRVIAVMERQIACHQPDCVVIACNTASTLVLPHLRARFPMPFVGTVPAIKPACAASQTRRISVLATPGTVARDYTRNLVATYAVECQVTMVGAPNLAALAEAVMHGRIADHAAIAREIEPCFVADDGGKTDAIVLACTHYPLLVDLFETLAPWPVRWIDPAPAIARRVVQLVGQAGKGEGTRQAIITGGQDHDQVARVFSSFGFATTAVDPLPLH